MKTETEFADPLCGQSRVALRIPFLAQEALSGTGFGHITSPVKGQRLPQTGICRQPGTLLW